MSDEFKSIKIRVKSGESEAEVEGPISSIKEAIELIPEVLAKLPSAGQERRLVPSVRTEAGSETTEKHTGAAISSAASASAVPVVSIEKGDSLSDVISKFFSDGWGRSPRKLMEVREALQSYGLNYPKQSVAVALLRLAKGSRIRRFKGESGEYVYTASTGSVRVQAPVHLETEQAVEAAQAQPMDGEVQEEQLDLDAPAAN
jgi:hypothetical protein